MILDLIDEAKDRGARQAKACETLGLNCRAIQRWKRNGMEDQRRGPKTSPANKLSDVEQQRMLNAMNSSKYRDLPPSQIVPQMADDGIYIASESTAYRLLRKNKQLKHRGRSKPRTSRRPEPCIATGPASVWSWDITYLKSLVRGQFFYLYLILDVWSRKIVGAAVYDRESPELAAELAEQACIAENIDGSSLIVLHSDNGGPMKGATMLATLERLGVVASFSRPHVSNDNPYSESLFRTLKYRPEYPELPFASLDQARAWVSRFIQWYNNEHHHSAIRFVTPAQRHDGHEIQILEKRRRVYEQAREARPERWTGKCRNWSPIETVELNPLRNRGDQPKEDAA